MVHTYIYHQRNLNISEVFLHKGAHIWSSLPVEVKEAMGHGLGKFQTLSILSINFKLGVRDGEGFI